LPRDAWILASPNGLFAKETRETLGSGDQALRRSHRLHLLLPEAAGELRLVSNNEREFGRVSGLAMESWARG
jgi:hypothetical protein